MPILMNAAVVGTKVKNICVRACPDIETLCSEGNTAAGVHCSVTFDCWVTDTVSGTALWLHMRQDRLGCDMAHIYDRRDYMLAQILMQRPAVARHRISRTSKQVLHDSLKICRSFRIRIRRVFLVRMACCPSIRVNCNSYFRYSWPATSKWTGHARARAAWHWHLQGGPFPATTKGMLATTVHPSQLTCQIPRQLFQLPLRFATLLSALPASSGPAGLQAQLRGTSAPP